MDLFRKINLKVIHKKTYFNVNSQHVDEKIKFIKKYIKNNNKFVLIHPGCVSSESWRRWPIERYLILAEMIAKDFRKNIIFIGGNDEKNLIYEINKNKNPMLTNAINKLTIGGCAALIKHSTLCIGNDSGIMHICGAMKTPVVNLIALLPPQRCKAWGTQNYIVTIKKTEYIKGKIDEISIEKVYNQVCLALNKQ